MSINFGGSKQNHLVSTWNYCSKPTSYQHSSLKLIHWGHTSLQSFGRFVVPFNGPVMFCFLMSNSMYVKGNSRILNLGKIKLRLEEKKSVICFKNWKQFPPFNSQNSWLSFLPPPPLKRPPPCFLFLHNSNYEYRIYGKNNTKKFLNAFSQKGCAMNFHNLKTFWFSSLQWNTQWPVLIKNLRMYYKKF